MQKSDITLERLRKKMSPSAKVFPLKPRSTEMLSSGSLTTLNRSGTKQKRAKVEILVSCFTRELHSEREKKRKKRLSSRKSTNPVW